MINNITIYCASSRHSPEKYLSAARELADILIDQNIGLVYGGGAVGLMGCLADRFLDRITSYNVCYTKLLRFVSA